MDRGGEIIEKLFSKSKQKEKPTLVVLSSETEGGL